jgi:hypothetical protein
VRVRVRKRVRVRVRVHEGDRLGQHGSGVCSDAVDVLNVLGGERAKRAKPDPVEVRSTGIILEDPWKGRSSKHQIGTEWKV